jgi:hypothetical protein
VDDAGNARITGFGSAAFEDERPQVTYNVNQSVPWAAPELLSAPPVDPGYSSSAEDPTMGPARALDIYAFAMTVVEVRPRHPHQMRAMTDPRI